MSNVDRDKVSEWEKSCEGSFQFFRNSKSWLELSDVGDASFFFKKISR